MIIKKIQFPKGLIYFDAHTGWVVTHVVDPRADEDTARSLRAVDRIDIEGYHTRTGIRMEDSKREFFHAVEVGYMGSPGNPRFYFPPVIR